MQGISYFCACHSLGSLPSYTRSRQVTLLLYHFTVQLLCPDTISNQWRQTFIPWPLGEQSPLASRPPLPLKSLFADLPFCFSLASSCTSSENLAAVSLSDLNIFPPALKNTGWSFNMLLSCELASSVCAFYLLRSKPMSELPSSLTGRYRASHSGRPWAKAQQPPGSERPLYLDRQGPISSSQTGR